MTKQQPHHGDRIAVAQQGDGGSPVAIYPGTGVAVSVLVIAALFVLTQLYAAIPLLGPVGASMGADATFALSTCFSVTYAVGFLVWGAYLGSLWTQEGDDGVDWSAGGGDTPMLRSFVAADASRAMGASGSGCVWVCAGGVGVFNRGCCSSVEGESNWRDVGSILGGRNFRAGAGINNRSARKLVMVFRCMRRRFGDDLYDHPFFCCRSSQSHAIDDVAAAVW